MFILPKTALEAHMLPVSGDESGIRMSKLHLSCNPSFKVRHLNLEGAHDRESCFKAHPGLQTIVESVSIRSSSFAGAVNV